MNKEISTLTENFTKLSAAEWLKAISKIKHTAFNFSEEQRKNLLLILIYSEFEELSVYHFQEFFQVSKGTVLADIKKLRAEMNESPYSLIYTRKNGFQLEGNELAIRKKAKNTITILLQSPGGKFGLYYWLSKHKAGLYQVTSQRLSENLQQGDLKIVPSRLNDITCFTALSIQRLTVYPLAAIDDFQLLSSLEAFSVSKKMLQQLTSSVNNSAEYAFFTACLMTVLQGEIQDKKLAFLLQSAAEIITQLEQLAAIEFDNYQELLIDLFNHLVPAYFRIKYDFYLPNYLLEDIKKEYADVYQLTNKALRPLEKLLAKQLPAEEIGFFAILFGGELNRKRTNSKKKLQALIVCPNGISSSLILETELKQLFPTIHFLAAHSIYQIDTIPKNEYDIIFSTIKINSPKKCYIVPPVMTQLEKNRLIHQVQTEWLIPNLSLPTAEEILAAIRPYISLKAGVDEEKIYRVLNRKMNKIITEKEDERPMLSELITPDMIQFSNKKLTWEQAIELAAEPMLKKGLIEPSYPQAMINKVKEFGPFIHIGKNIALPHARPEDGVNQIGMSLLKVEPPVNLLNDSQHAIKIFICLAAVDNDAHLRALANLTKLLSKKEQLNALLSATTKEEILAIITKGDE